jgi:hypothetical protein
VGSSLPAGALCAQRTRLEAAEARYAGRRPLPCSMAGDCPAASALPWPGSSLAQVTPGGELQGQSAPGPPRMLGEGERARAVGCRPPTGLRGWPRAARRAALFGGLRGAARSPHQPRGRARSVRTRVRWRSFRRGRTANPQGLQRCTLLPSGRRVGARLPCRSMEFTQAFPGAEAVES